MTNVELYLLVGVPAILMLILINILAGAVQRNSIVAKLTNFEANLNARFTSLEARLRDGHWEG